MNEFGWVVISNLILVTLALLVVITAILSVYQFTTPLLQQATNTMTTQSHHQLKQQYMKQRIYHLRRAVIIGTILVILNIGVVVYTGIPTLVSQGTTPFLLQQPHFNMVQCVHIAYIGLFLWIFWHVPSSQ